VPSSTTTMKGTVHGRTIELETESGLPDGQRVTVVVEPVSPETTATCWIAPTAVLNSGILSVRSSNRSKTKDTKNSSQQDVFTLR
jgi:hypothetical protein